MSLQRVLNCKGDAKWHPRNNKPPQIANHLECNPKDIHIWDVRVTSLPVYYTGTVLVSTSFKVRARVRSFLKRADKFKCVKRDGWITVENSTTEISMVPNRNPSSVIRQWEPICQWAMETIHVILWITVNIILTVTNQWKPPATTTVTVPEDLIFSKIYYAMPFLCDYKYAADALVGSNTSQGQ